MLMQSGAARKSPTSNTNGVRPNKSLSFQQYRSILTFNNEQKFYSVTNTNNETETPIATQNDLWDTMLLDTWAIQEKLEMETKSKSSSSRHSNSIPTFPFVLCHLDESNTCGQERYELIESILREEKGNSDVDFFLDEIPIYNYIFSKDENGKEKEQDKEKEKEKEKENTDKLNGACFYSSMTSTIARTISSYNMIYATPLSSSLKTRKSSLLNYLNEKDDSEIEIPRAVSIYTSPGVFLSHHKAEQMLTQFSDTSKTTCSNDFNAAFSVSASSIDESHFFFKIQDERKDRVTHECLKLFIDYLTEKSDIISVDLVMKTFPLNEIASWIIQGSPEVNTLPWYDLGLDGSGEIVQVSDSGLDESHCYIRDKNGEVPLTEDFDLTGKIDNTKRKVIQYVALSGFGDREDYSHHGSHVVGTILGKRSDDGVNEVTGLVDGIAPASKVAFFDANSDPENDMTFLIPLDISQMFYFGRQAKAFAHSASWGSNSDGGQYTSRVREVDQYFYESEDDDFIMFLAAGNDGSTIGAKIDEPSASKNVISVGASHSYGKNLYNNMRGFDYVASFSSRGPTADNRIKPDIIAPGHPLLSIKAESNGECDPDYRPQYMGPGNQDHAGLTFKSGTSMSCPVAVGAGALVRQYFREIHDPPMDISGTLLKAVLINGAEALVGRSTSPYGSESEPSTLYDGFQGYGRLNLLNSLKHPSSSIDSPDVYVEDAMVLQQGQAHEYEFNVCDAHDFRVTVVWQDPPGQVGCKKCLVNDLDLEVLFDSKTYHPNGRTSRDSRNNVERVILSRDDFSSDDSNSVIVKVNAENLGFGETQKYSLASNGCINDVAIVTPTPSPTRSCGSDEFEYTVDIFTNRKPEETSWKLEYQGSGEVIAAVRAGEYEEGVDRLKSIFEKGCAMYGCFLFIIKDTAFDGLCCEKGMGSYSIRAYDEVLIESDSFVDRQKIEKFCYYGNDAIEPTTSPTMLLCNDDEFKYQIDIETDLYPDETRWLLLRKPRIDGVDKGNYTERYGEYVHEGCLDHGGCYSFYVYGGRYDGEYSITANDFVLFDREEFLGGGKLEEFCYAGESNNSTPSYGIRTSVVGGFEGDKFDDVHSLWEYGKIVQIELYVRLYGKGSMVDFIGITYETGQSFEHGWKYGTQYIITLDEDQYITQVSGWAYYYICELKFTTNDGEIFGPYGSGWNGYPFEFDFGENALVYIFGKSSGEIHQLGFSHASLLSTTDSPTYQPTTSSCGINQFRYEIIIRTDYYPEDVRWELHSIVDSVPFMTYQNQLESYSHRGCLTIDENHEFLMIDRRRDGLCCYFGSGYYKLSVENNVVVQGDHFDDAISVGGYSWYKKPDFFFNKHEFSYSSTLQPTPLPVTCSNDEFEYRIRVRTNYYPGSTSWTFKYLNGTEIESVVYGEYFLEHYEYNHRGCRPLNNCFEFYIHNDWGGLCCDYGNGGYKIFANDVVMAEGREFDDEETTEFCYGPSFSLSPSSNPSINPTFQPSSKPSLFCSKNMGFKYVVVITTDITPEDTFWELNYTNGTIIDSVEEGYYTNYLYEYVHEGCLDLDSCVTFTIFTSYRWGFSGRYKIFADDIIMAKGEKRWFHEKTHTFCYGPSYSLSPSTHPSTLNPTSSNHPSFSSSPSFIINICENGSNNHRYCGYFASIGACENSGSQDWMWENCARACSNCCLDFWGMCDYYASEGYCTSTSPCWYSDVTWKEWMQASCRVSCNTCDVDFTPSPTPPVTCSDDKFKYEIVFTNDDDYYSDWSLYYKYPEQIDGYDVYGYNKYFPPKYEKRFYGCVKYSCFDLRVKKAYLKMYDKDKDILIAQNTERYENLRFCHYTQQPTTLPTKSPSPTKSTPLEAIFTISLKFSTSAAEKVEYVSAVVERSIRKILFSAYIDVESVVLDILDYSSCEDSTCDISVQVCEGSCGEGEDPDFLAVVGTTMNEELGTGELLTSVKQTGHYMDIEIFDNLMNNNPISIKFDFEYDAWPTSDTTSATTIPSSTPPIIQDCDAPVIVQNLFGLIANIFRPITQAITNTTDPISDVLFGVESYNSTGITTCKDKMFELQIEILTDGSPEKTSWELLYENGTIIDSIGRDTYSEYDTVYNHTYCLDTSCFVFNIFDSFEFKGSYNITVEGTVLAYGDSFMWWKESKRFCYPQCDDDDGMFALQIELMTDDWPQETSWDLTFDNGTLVDHVDKRYYTGRNSVHNHRYCLLDGCYNVLFKDYIGDGMCCSYGEGSYNMKINDDNVIREGGKFGDGVRKSFCHVTGETSDEENNSFLFGIITDLFGGESCCTTDTTGYSTPYPTTTSKPSMLPSSNPSSNPSLQPSIRPSIQPSSNPSPNPSSQPSLSSIPSSLPSSIKTLPPVDNYKIWFDGDSWDGSKWLDKSTNEHHAVDLHGTINRALDQNNDMNYLFGNTNSGVTISSGWPSGSEYTFLHVTKYNGPTKGRIWSGTTGNWLSGHHSGRRGKFYHEGWITEDISIGDVDSWGIFTDRVNSSGSNVRVDGVDVTTNSSPKFIPGGIGVNNLYSWVLQKSDWAVALVLVYDRYLDENEVLSVEDWIRTEYFSSFTTSPSFNPTTSEVPSFKISALPSSSPSISIQPSMSPSSSYGVIRTAAAGSSTKGSPFDDRHPPWTYGRITQIELYADSVVICYIGITYTDGQSFVHGKKYSWASKHIITLGEDQYITKVSGRTDSYIHQLKLERNDGQIFGPYGHSATYLTPFNFDFGENALIYIFGRAGTYLHQLGFAHVPLPTLSPTVSNIPSSIPSISSNPSFNPSSKPSISSVPSFNPSLSSNPSFNPCSIQQFIGQSFEAPTGSYTYKIDNLGITESEFKQWYSNNGYYLIGTFQTFDGDNKAIYTNGDGCGLYRKREGTFEIEETDDPAQNGVMTASEPSSCVYRFVRKCYYPSST